MAGHSHSANIAVRKGKQDALRAKLFSKLSRYIMIAARNGGSAGAGPYGAAKGFVSTLTHGLAKELIGSGIRVNAVAPGVIATPFHARYSTEAQLAAAVATIPAGRVGTPEECVGAYLFLASKALSGYVVGQVIEVNGGQLMP